MANKLAYNLNFKTDIIKLITIVMLLNEKQFLNLSDYMLIHNDTFESL